MVRYGDSGGIVVGVNEFTTACKCYYYTRHILSLLIQINTNDKYNATTMRQYTMQ